MLKKLCLTLMLIDFLETNIFTGNILIKRNKVRKLFTTRPKYQENKIISFEKVQLDSITGPNVSTETWCTKHGYDKNLEIK